MFNFFRKKQVIEVMPAPGEVWYIMRPSDGSPFPPRRTGTGATILEVKDNWVRFDISWPLLDQRMRVEDFVRKYVK